MPLVAYTLNRPKAMDDYAHFVGIDVSKHTLDVMLWRFEADALVKTRCQGSNDALGHAQTIQWLKQHQARRRPRSS